jgi:2-desacetyl-2-hydroxyethyl bacteriochlorophyllide A dehydrogenase
MAEKITFVETHAQLKSYLPRNPQKNEIFVRATKSMISPGTERAALMQVWDDPAFREDPGYQLVGVIEDIGANVEQFKIGDRITSLHSHASLATMSTHPWMVLPIPKEVTDEEAAFVALGSVALHAIRRMQIQLGETLFIFGAGIIGLIALQLAKLNGIQQVIISDRSDFRLDLAKKLGADVTLNPDHVDVKAELHKLTNGKGAEIVLEAVGHTAILPIAFEYAAIGGRVICIGILEQKVPMHFHKTFIQKELSLIAAYQPLNPTQDTIYWHHTQQANRALLLDLIAQKKLNVKDIITHRLDIQEAPAFYERLKKQDYSMLGIILDWTKL